MDSFYRSYEESNTFWATEHGSFCQTCTMEQASSPTAVACLTAKAKQNLVQLRWQNRTQEEEPKGDKKEEKKCEAANSAEAAEMEEEKAEKKDADGGSKCDRRKHNIPLGQKFIIM